MFNEICTIIECNDQAKWPKLDLFLYQEQKVWKHLAFEADDKDNIKNSSVVFCQVSKCNACIVYSNTTTNILLHLKQCHPYSEIVTSSHDDESSIPSKCKVS